MALAQNPEAVKKSNVPSADPNQFKVSTNTASTGKILISESAQVEFIEKTRAEQVHLEELNKLLATAKDDADKEYMATEINKLVATLFYEVKNFKSAFSLENQRDLRSILSAINADMDSTAQQVGLEIEIKKVPNASAKHLESLLASEGAQSTYDIAIKDMHQEIRLFAKDELKVDPDDFMIRFVEFERRMKENRRILRGMIRPGSNISQNSEEINLPQYSV